MANGASGLLCNAMIGFMNPDDEMIVIEPAFEYYYEQNNVFGGITRYFEMTPPSKTSSQWTINFAELRKYFNDKTKLFVLNTPQNPSGKMLTEEEANELIAILKDFPKVILLSDEVNIIFKAQKAST